MTGPFHDTEGNELVGIKRCERDGLGVVTAASRETLDRRAVELVAEHCIGQGLRYQRAIRTAALGTVTERLPVRGTTPSPAERYVAPQLITSRLGQGAR
jgi:hypothetical protein